MTAQIIVYGISLGCVYAIVALGLVLIYRATELVNFAQGEMMMMSAYVFLLSIPWKWVCLPLF